MHDDDNDKHEWADGWNAEQMSQPLFRRADLERAIATDDEMRWARLRDQRLLLRNLGNQARYAPDAHPVTRIAARVARTAAWLLEPVPGPGTEVETRARHLAAWSGAIGIIIATIALLTTAARILL